MNAPGQITRKSIFLCTGMYWDLAILCTAMYWDLKKYIAGHPEERSAIVSVLSSSLAADIWRFDLH